MLRALCSLSDALTSRDDADSGGSSRMSLSRYVVFRSAHRALRPQKPQLLALGLAEVFRGMPQEPEELVLEA